MKRCLAGLLFWLATVALSEGAVLLGEYSTNGISISAGFIPDSTEIILREPMFVTFVISNRAAQPFHFSHVRNEIFTINATNAAGEPVKSAYWGMDGNGFVSEVTVPSGQTYAMRIFLNERCRFEQPGEYAVNCRCNFWHHPPGSNYLSRPIVTVFTVSVRANYAARVTELIAAWGHSLLTNGSPLEAGQALAEFNDVDERNLREHGF